ncbi:UDP-N-acetylmuramate--L-alanine ligase [Sulfuriroseicoccus oceanibius]|uniref:Multifunctional fusion protein n=2 Tax=Sulfuriroseicoccus oceanibius TaxID=2707525 RepID=A0A6B3LAL3_9BACT|nr:UDP-N-acetylmuramate--L-alanine ligase [Sulfuriroseicoccus oceanibius]
MNSLASGDRRLDVHLIGVAGSGMSGIAGMMLELGHAVSGSDRVSSAEVERLQGLGLRFTSPQTPASVNGADIVIYSSAIRPGNVAYDAAAAAGLPMVRRADALAAVLNARRGVVVAGTHGKTTTSSLTAHVLRTGKVESGHYVGAEIPVLGTNAHVAENGGYFVAEGDESDGTLVKYHPEHTILLNIEEEHLDFYSGLDEINQVFKTLCDQTSGTVYFCGADANAAALCRGRERTVSYGWDEDCDLYATNVHFNRRETAFNVVRNGEDLGEFLLGVPGRHNVLNAMAAIAVAQDLGVDAAAIRDALRTFHGARRRFESRYRSERFSVVDDYGHHPTEIAATMEAARALNPQRILTLFQPHRYSRTQRLRDEFGRSFWMADQLVVSDIYPASEQPIPGITGQTVADAVGECAQRDDLTVRAQYVPTLKQARLTIGNLARPGDMLITLGAGNVHECAVPLARDLKTLESLVAASGESEMKARLYEPMKKHTTIRIGGPAQFWVEPTTFDGFAGIVRYCREHEIPVRVVGRGSNLLVRDGGIPGVVIHPNGGEFSEVKTSGTRITAGVGTRFKKLTAVARDQGIAGFEWMEGIPGNVGGGLRMNAGAMGTSTFDQVVSVLLINRKGELEWRPASKMVAQYRNVAELVDEYALAATFEGQEGDRDAIDELIAESKDKRKSSQPVAASAGCIFKNPEPCPAGKLVDELGMKGSSVGKIRVSDIHGNFIVNEGGGTAREMLQLIERIKSEARASRGIEMETEVQIIGEDEVNF